jgi:ribosomal subunit interface protein
MQIEIRTDNHIDGSESLNGHVQEWLHRPLEKYSRRLTRIEVHLSDAIGDKHAPGDKVCKLEARIEGRQPTAVHHHAETLQAAVTGAAAKLDRVLEKEFGKLAAH